MMVSITGGRSRRTSLGPPNSIYLPTPFTTPPLRRQCIGDSLQSLHGSSGGSGSSSWMLWRDPNSLAYNRENKGRVCSYILAIVVFLVIIVVLAIAALAVYMGALRIDKTHHKNSTKQQEFNQNDNSTFEIRNGVLRKVHTNANSTSTTLRKRNVTESTKLKLESADNDTPVIKNFNNVEHNDTVSDSNYILKNVTTNHMPKTGNKQKSNISQDSESTLLVTKLNEGVYNAKEGSLKTWSDMTTPQKETLKTNQFEAKDSQVIKVISNTTYLSQVNTVKSNESLGHSISDKKNATEITKNSDDVKKQNFQDLMTTEKIYSVTSISDQYLDNPVTTTVQIKSTNLTFQPSSSHQGNEMSWKGKNTSNSDLTKSSSTIGKESGRNHLEINQNTQLSERYPSSQFTAGNQNINQSPFVQEYDKFVRKAVNVISTTPKSLTLLSLTQIFELKNTTKQPLELSTKSTETSPPVYKLTNVRNHSGTSSLFKTSMNTTNDSVYTEDLQASKSLTAFNVDNIEHKNDTESERVTTQPSIHTRFPPRQNIHVSSKVHPASETSERQSTNESTTSVSSELFTVTGDSKINAVGDNGRKNPQQHITYPGEETKEIELSTDKFLNRMGTTVSLENQDTSAQLRYTGLYTDGKVSSEPMVLNPSGLHNVIHPTILSQNTYMDRYEHFSSVIGAPSFNSQNRKTTVNKHSSETTFGVRKNQSNENNYSHDTIKTSNLSEISDETLMFKISPSYVAENTWRPIVPKLGTNAPVNYGIGVRVDNGDKRESLNSPSTNVNKQPNENTVMQIPASETEIDKPNSHHLENDRPLSTENIKVVGVDSTDQISQISLKENYAITSTKHIVLKPSEKGDIIINNGNITKDERANMNLTSDTLHVPREGENGLKNTSNYEIRYASSEAYDWLDLPIVQQFKNIGFNFKNKSNVENPVLHYIAESTTKTSLHAVEVKDVVNIITVKPEKVISEVFDGGAVIEHQGIAQPIIENSEFLESTTVLGELWSTNQSSEKTVQTLKPPKSNSGIGRPLRPRPKFNTYNTTNFVNHSTFRNPVKISHPHSQTEVPNALETFGSTPQFPNDLTTIAWVDNSPILSLNSSQKNKTQNLNPTQLFKFPFHISNTKKSEIIIGEHHTQKADSYTATTTTPIDVVTLQSLHVSFSEDMLSNSSMKIGHSQLIDTSHYDKNTNKWNSTHDHFNNTNERSKVIDKYGNNVHTASLVNRTRTKDSFRVNTSALRNLTKNLNNNNNDYKSQFSSMAISYIPETVIDVPPLTRVVSSLQFQEEPKATNHTIKKIISNDRQPKMGSPTENVRFDKRRVEKNSEHSKGIINFTRNSSNGVLEVPNTHEVEVRMSLEEIVKIYRTKVTNCCQPQRNFSISFDEQKKEKHSNLTDTKQNTNLPQLKSEQPPKEYPINFGTLYNITSKYSMPKLDSQESEEVSNFDIIQSDKNQIKNTPKITTSLLTALKSINDPMTSLDMLHSTSSTEYSNSMYDNHTVSGEDHSTLSYMENSTRQLQHFSTKFNHVTPETQTLPIDILDTILVPESNFSTFPEIGVKYSSHKLPSNSEKLSLEPSYQTSEINRTVTDRNDISTFTNFSWLNKTKQSITQNQINSYVQNLPNENLDTIQFVSESMKKGSSNISNISNHGIINRKHTYVENTHRVNYPIGDAIVNAISKLAKVHVYSSDDNNSADTAKNNNSVINTPTPSIDNNINTDAGNSFPNRENSKLSVDFNTTKPEKIKLKEAQNGIGENKNGIWTFDGTLKNFSTTYYYSLPEEQSNVTVNPLRIPTLTKVFTKISPENSDTVSTFEVELNVKNKNNTDCSTGVLCGDGECVSILSRCNQLIDCSDGVDERDCTCGDYLKAQFLTRKICDGVVDCWDYTDENNCEWCSPGQFVCANTQMCIDSQNLCNGARDCPYGDDEKHCVTIAPPMSNATDFSYHAKGVLMVRKHGKWGKLCVQNFESVVNESHSSWEVKDLGKAVCKAMTFRDCDQVERITDTSITAEEGGSLYYELGYSPEESYLRSIQSSLVFRTSECSDREVLQVTCLDLQCGIRPQAVNQWARSRRSRIVGGGNAGPGSWPWQAALYKEGEFQCGATLISERWLVSAGHCFYHALDDFWVARLGALRRGTNFPSPYEQLRSISDILLHPRYVDAGFINDISLLQLRDPVTFSDYVRPICLPQPISHLKDGRLCTVVGWGQLFEVGRVFPDTLQEVQLPIISTPECRKRTLFLPLYRVTDNMFCAGFDRGGRDACLGDSGGPLMCQESDGHWTLYGVTSNGYGCARANRPGVYTKVSNYVSWIYSSMSQHASVKSFKSTCKGHRCPLGECLPRSRVCNGYMECSDGSDEKDCW